MLARHPFDMEFKDIVKHRRTTPLGGWMLLVWPTGLFNAERQMSFSQVVVSICLSPQFFSRLRRPLIAYLEMIRMPTVRLTGVLPVYFWGKEREYAFWKITNTPGSEGHPSMGKSLVLDRPMMPMALDLRQLMAGTMLELYGLRC